MTDMLKKSEKINTSDEYVKSDNLTDKWKKGELPSGFYYVKNEFGNIFPSDYSEHYDYIGDTVIKDFFTEVSEIKEVLEPVPSFEEWQRIFHYASKYEHEYTSCAMDYENLKEENTKFKELLKECRSPINYALCLNLSIEEKIEFKNLLAKISQVLGEAICREKSKFDEKEYYKALLGEE